MVTSSKVTQPCHGGDSPFHDQLLSSGLPVCPPPPQLPNSEEIPGPGSTDSFLVPHLTAVSVHSTHQQVSSKTPVKLWASSAGPSPLFCGPPPMSPTSGFHIQTNMHSVFSLNPQYQAPGANGSHSLLYAYQVLDCNSYPRCHGTLPPSQSTS